MLRRGLQLVPHLFGIHPLTQRMRMPISFVVRCATLQPAGKLTFAPIRMFATYTVNLPNLADSITEGRVQQLKKRKEVFNLEPGEAVEVDETVAVIETDKVSVEIKAPKAGVLTKFHAKVGEDLAVGKPFFDIDTEGKAQGKSESKEEKGSKDNNDNKDNRDNRDNKDNRDNRDNRDQKDNRQEGNVDGKEGKEGKQRKEGKEERDARPSKDDKPTERKTDERQTSDKKRDDKPSERKQSAPQRSEDKQQKPTPAKDDKKKEGAPSPKPQQPSIFSSNAVGERKTKSEPLSKLRTKVGQRLKEAQNTYALLTTFQEVDMGEVMEIRKVNIEQLQTYQEEFVNKYGIKLGFMSFFIKAAVAALQEYPIVNAVIDGTNMIQRNYIDISIAVATPTGLMVPVLRNCHTLKLHEIELQMAELAKKGKNGKLTLEDINGGTFTISNGGTFGSLMGTPIINPPQSAILGMHAVINRPVVRGDQIVARPMMYLALTYDHRLLDGKDAVLFLKRIQNCVEDPKRILLEV